MCNIKTCTATHCVTNDNGKCAVNLTACCNYVLQSAALIEHIANEKRAFAHWHKVSVARCMAGKCDATDCSPCANNYKHYIRRIKSLYAKLRGL